MHPWLLPRQHEAGDEIATDADAVRATRTCLPAEIVVRVAPMISAIAEPKFPEQSPAGKGLESGTTAVAHPCQLTAGPPAPDITPSLQAVTRQ